MDARQYTTTERRNWKFEVASRIQKTQGFGSAAIEGFGGGSIAAVFPA
jgi:hypothetical protein